jgi:anti-sigma B factor antagonist
MLLRLVVESQNGHVLIRAAGELDLSSAPSLATAAENAFADGYQILLLDLSGITFMDSTGISSVLTAHRAAQARGAVVAVIAPSDIAMRVLQLIGVEHLLHIYDTIEEALAEHA